MNHFLFRSHYDVGELRQSLVIWLVLGSPAVTIVLCCAFCFGFLAWEYMHNPNRHLYEATIMAPAISIIIFVIASIAQIIPYVILPFYVRALLRLFGRVPLLLLIALTPLLGLAVWFGYGHFLPDYHWYTDESPPYVYGLTLVRFLYGWAFELIIVLVYWWPFRSLRLDPAVTQAGTAQ